VILAGDFNTWSNLRYKSLQDVAEQMGLAEVKLAKRRTRLSHFKRHLDHLFYKGLELVKAEMLTNVITSDHFPITAEFKIL
jgi:endonuclease/exonuclease/phosphatase (EEP) superfamily protein YafD